MKIAVLSGKGGAGKTFVASNLAASLDQAVYVDCDVEEPNGRLFLKPVDIRQTVVAQKVPTFDPAKCTGCRKCVDLCKFNALIYIKGTPKVFTEVCHSCGLCAMACPVGAITEVDRPIGHVEVGYHGNSHVVTGVLNTGEASGVGVIQAALCEANGKIVIIDCPPGSACSVQESIGDADYCILTAEPTAFGFHNFQMVYELVKLLGKPCGVVINKMDVPYMPLETFCEAHQIPVLLRIPYRSDLAQWISCGELACERDQNLKESFRSIVKKIGGDLQ